MRPSEREMENCKQNLELKFLSHPVEAINLYHYQYYHHNSILKLQNNRYQRSLIRKHKTRRARHWIEDFVEHNHHDHYNRLGNQLDSNEKRKILR